MTDPTDTATADLMNHGAHFTRLPLAQVEPSLTNPRKHFDAAKLQELAESIKASDIHQPILVRPLPGSRVADTAWEPGSLTPRKVKPTHEIVAGERRYRAAKLAGLDTVPVLVRHLLDDQVLEIQILENLQRTDLTELEEAEGYQTLMQHSDLTADELAAKLGKSRSYVYNRLKLLDLCTEARQALAAGQVDASVALLVARIPNTAIQAKALQTIVDQNGSDGHRMSARSAADMIRRQYMLNLDTAPFDIRAAALTPAGACSTCPKRTGANPDLFAEVKGADLCTDPTCFEAKRTAHQEAAMATAHKRGLTVIEGREAKALMPSAWTNRIDGHLRLDDKADSPTGQPLRKVLAKAMAKAGVKETLLANPHRNGELVAVLTTAQVNELLELATELDAEAQPVAQAMAEKTKAEIKAERAALAATRVAEYETAWRWALLEEVWAEAKQWNGMPGSDDLTRHIAIGMANRLNQDRCKRLNKLLGLDKVAPQDTLLEHIRQCQSPLALLWLLVAEADVEYRSWLKDDPTANAGLLLAAKAFEVDVEAVQKNVQAELKEKHAAEDQKPLLPLAPAAQANGVRGGGGGNGKGKKAPAAQAKPKLSVEEAKQCIATAMQGLEEDQAHPLGAPDEPCGSDQRPAADGIDASPLATPAEPQPGPARPPAPGEATPSNGPASTAQPAAVAGEPAQARPAGELGIGAKVRVLPNATGTRQTPHIGREGVVDRRVGDSAWDVKLPGKKRLTPQWVCFDASELEVVG